MERPPSDEVAEPDRSYLTTPTATATSLDLLSRRRWLVIAAVIVAVVGGALVLRWTAREQPSTSESPSAGASRPVAGSTATSPEEPFSFEEKDRIVVGTLENKTGESVLDDSVDYAFRLRLEQSRFAQVLSDSQIRAVLQRMQRESEVVIGRDLGIEICKREGAKALVTGSIVKIGEAYNPERHHHRSRVGGQHLLDQRDCRESERHRSGA